MRRNRQVQRLPAEQDGRAFIDKEDDAEGREHLLNMVAGIKPPDHHELDDQAGERRGRETGEGREHERPGTLADQRRAVGSDHVERAVRQIDDAHDAEDQRQSCRQQEQHYAELDAVECLLERQRHGFAAGPRSSRARLELTLLGIGVAVVQT